MFDKKVIISWRNKANLRDLIAATGVVILLKMDSIIDFSARTTLKFDGWPQKIIGHLFYTTSSFVHHFKAISELKRVTVRKRSIQVKMGDFLSRVTFKFDGWPWKAIWHFFNIMFSFVHDFKAINELKLELQSGNAQFRSKSVLFVPCDLQIWRITFKNNRAPVLCRFKLCASFHSHQWIQTKVTAQKRLIRVKIGNFLSCETFKFHGWPWKAIGHLFMLR